MFETDKSAIVTGRLMGLIEGFLLIILFVSLVVVILNHWLLIFG